MWWWLCGLITETSSSWRQGTTAPLFGLLVIRWSWRFEEKVWEEKGELRYQTVSQFCGIHNLDPPLWCFYKSVFIKLFQSFAAFAIHPSGAFASFYLNTLEHQWWNKNNFWHLKFKVLNLVKVWQWDFFMVENWEFGKLTLHTEPFREKPRSQE